MILLLLGTHEQPFERALDIVLPCGETQPLVVQHGHTPPRSGAAGVEWFEFAPYDRILDLCGRATSIVCHAGVGTIMTARGVGKTPVVIPRVAARGEHVDDHQLQIARAFSQSGLIVWLADGAEIELALATAATARPRAAAGEALRRAVAAAVG